MIAGKSCRLPPAHFKNGAVSVGEDAFTDDDGDTSAATVLRAVRARRFAFSDGTNAWRPGFSAVFCSFFVFRGNLSA
jgi:hypothetical protein